MVTGARGIRQQVALTSLPVTVGPARTGVNLAQVQVRIISDKAVMVLVRSFPDYSRTTGLARQESGPGKAKRRGAGYTHRSWSETARRTPPSPRKDAREFHEDALERGDRRHRVAST